MSEPLEPVSTDSSSGEESEYEEQDQPETENVDEHGEGMQNPNWVAFLEGIKKSDEYRRRVLHFLVWKKANGKTEDENAAVIDYFEQYKPNKVEGEPSRPAYAATTLRQY